MPPGYRERALLRYGQSDYSSYHSQPENLHQALCRGFIWRDTHEGHDFWKEMSRWSLGTSPLPDLKNEKLL